ncbi:hypothetical protein NDU88_003786 [Pleurodeles waltl]|uniref:Uncharacterized protein n=1 Tax=Pleurodeles waltl TaxID=8319 RepID=A0AAV7QCR4_PLEWA|nr:hypothetical protein NDU88_003786 [Pleurodeles waltl]
MKWRLPDLESGTMGYEVTALAWYTVAVGGRRPQRNPALVNIGPCGSQEPMTMYAVGDGKDLHCKCCCDLSLEETMARVSGERAPAFSTEELEKLVDGVLPSTRYSTVLQTNRQSPTRRRTFGVPSPWKSGPWGSTTDGAPTAGNDVRTFAAGARRRQRPSWGWPPNVGGVPSHHDPPDVQDPGGGVPGVGWALEGITAATRG